MWRAEAAAARFVLRRSFDGAAERLSCVDPETDDPCAAWVSDRLLAPATDRLFAVLMRRMLLQMPFPIVRETVGAHRLVVCTGE